jgi:hypothetical protein
MEDKHDPLALIRSMIREIVVYISKRSGSWVWIECGRSVRTGTKVARLLRVTRVEFDSLDRDSLDLIKRDLVEDRIWQVGHFSTPT